MRTLAENNALLTVKHNIVELETIIPNNTSVVSCFIDRGRGFQINYCTALFVWPSVPWSFPENYILQAMWSHYTLAASHGKRNKK